MFSITYRITGLMFLLVAGTVFILIYLANQQMTDLFGHYLQNADIDSNCVAMGMGLHEREFLTSVHQSLIWVGGVLLLAGFAASYALARSITVPLRKLSSAVGEIEKGNFEHKVAVDSKDEVAQLALAFNSMSDRLDNNNRMRRQLLADIAHELRTPLAVVQGNLEGMLEGVIDADKEQLSSLYEETVHLSRLIKDLRDLSLAEAGQLTLEKKSTDITQLISRALGMLKPLADEKGIQFDHVVESIPEVMVDAGRINQVLYNLLTNALRYTYENGVIRITASVTEARDKEWVKIAISDTGSGIPTADLPHIFDHFYRAEKSRDRKSGGSGIGLAIVKQLVEVHGGYVEVESEPGVGSSFYVYLPVGNS